MILHRITGVCAICGVEKTVIQPTHDLAVAALEALFQAHEREAHSSSRSVS